MSTGYKVHNQLVKFLENIVFKNATSLYSKSRKRRSPVKRKLFKHQRYLFRTSLPRHVEKNVVNKLGILGSFRSFLTMWACMSSTALILHGHNTCPEAGAPLPVPERILSNNTGENVLTANVPECEPAILLFIHLLTRNKPIETSPRLQECPGKMTSNRQQ